ncbi:prephenate dehydratase [Allocatelliglobosispora scoriae]|uniref:Prephenate dehydratase n=1 Tax=Allocatelliglobosispora scoriae TaxID=643052 RepID=A0A841BY22_9ACTN|nr:prephenate dehydratase domain-containing protein [Allocatelliglobosispora scoriae]MBB5871682.1 prephenate dehydratase [Allocatelliglobosispora scoriae]
MEKRIAYLGPAGTFTHTAAREIWGDRALLRPVSAVDFIIGELMAGGADFGVIPLENTVEGIVTASVDELVFRTAGIVILREVSVPITFDAYRGRADRDDGTDQPTVIASHAHGLAQCRRYVAASGLPTKHFASTAAAVEAAVAEPGMIAIGAPGLASRYDVEVIDQAVEDHTGAYTRFACIGSDDPATAALPPAPDDVAWKTTLALTPSASRPGVLAELCTLLADQGINIISLTSRPLPGFPGAYVFVLTLAEDPDSVHVARGVQGILHSGVRLKFLGSYLSDHLVRPAPSDRLLTPPIGSFDIKDFHRVVARFPGRPAASGPVG